MKKTVANARLDDETFAAVRERMQTLGHKDVSEYLRALIAADLKKPPPDELLRQELAVMLYAVLSSWDRVGSSESAKKVTTAYLAGRFRHIVSPAVSSEEPAKVEVTS